MNPLRTVLRLVGTGLLSLGLSSPLLAAGVDKQISAALDANQATEALILLDDSQQTRALGVKSEQALNALDSTEYARYLTSKANALSSLKETVLQQVNGELQVLTNYSALPVLHVRLNNANALKGLLASGKVLSVDPNRANQAFLTQSLPLIKQPQAQAAGYAGSGATVCVLDTGVNYTLSAFGSCSAPGGNCKIAYSADVAASDGLLDDSSKHGTNVAATVLGVAPSARVAMLDVFRSDGYAYDSDLISALNWCISNKSAYNITSLNMSLGGGRYYSLQPTTDSWGTAINNAINSGIVVVAAAGNERYTDSLSLPAAYNGVVSVGAVYDSNMGGINWSSCADATTAADKVTCFSNSASFLSMWAPGAIITAANISMGGTSQASPHVAGAVAVLKAAFPSETVSQIKARLLKGPNVTDSRNAVTKPRLDLYAALDLVTVSATAGSGGTVSPSSSLVSKGYTTSFTVTANSGYTRSNSVTGTCAAGTWSGNVYTTGVVSAACNVGFSFTTNTQYTVTATAGTGGTVSPSSTSVASGGTASFTVTANSGYTRSNTVTGSCAAGTWSGNVYTTGVVSAACNVGFSFTTNTQYTVTATAGTGGTVSPSSTSVASGGTASFTVTANSGYTRSNTVTGSCAAGTWSGNVYTTGVVSAACSVGFSFTANTAQYTVTATAGTGGTVSPSSTSVASGGKASFTVTANSGYTRSNTVTGTCVAGTWSGNVYTTGVVSAACSVGFSFTANTQYTVTATAGTGGTVSPSSTKVASGGKASFTVTPSSGYARNSTVVGNCPAGTWSGNTYTTGAVSANCSVSFSFSRQYTVTATAATGGTVSPTSTVVLSGSKASFTVTPSVGYVRNYVSTTCPIGTWSGNTYTTGAIGTNCTQTFYFRRVY